MSLETEPRHIAVLQLLTGHFHEGSGYRAVRQGGVEDWLLIYTAAGAGRFGHAGGEFIARPGDWVLLQPGTPHDYGVEPSLRCWELIWAHFQPRPDWQAWLKWPSVHRGLMCLSLPPASDAVAARSFARAHALLNGDLHRREIFAMNALEEALLHCDQHNPLATGPAGDDRVRRAMDFLERNLDRKTSLDDVANAVGLSASRLAHLFKSASGQTPQRYLEARRMQRAAELLERTGFSVKQIAAVVGFDNPLYFSQRFKDWTRQSPTEFRRARMRGERPTASPPPAP